jgi:hypothetical protein
MVYAPILIRGAEGKWLKAEQVEFADEQALQNLLFMSPELIERTTAGPLVFAKESAITSACFADLVGVASNGEILLIETKLARNPEIRRKVIGQILEYAAFLWQMDFGSFDNFFIKSNGKTAFESLAHFEPDIDKELFRATVQENLQAGRFVLLIAVDEITHELDKILSYLSNRGAALQLEALAVRIYRKGETQILVPKRYGGRQNVAPQNQASPRKLTVEQIIANAQDEHTRSLLMLIVERWQGNGLYVDPGSVGISCKASINGKTASMFWASPTESGLQPNFVALDQIGISQELRSSLRKRVGNLSGFPSEKCDKQSYVTVKFSAITPQVIEAFLETMIGVVEEARKELL